jgi:hypothetical protein
MLAAANNGATTQVLDKRIKLVRWVREAIVIEKSIRTTTPFLADCRANWSTILKIGSRPRELGIIDG